MQTTNTNADYGMYSRQFELPDDVLPGALVTNRVSFPAVKLILSCTRCNGTTKVMVDTIALTYEKTTKFSAEKFSFRHFIHYFNVSDVVFTTSM